MTSLLSVFRRSLFLRVGLMLIITAVLFLLILQAVIQSTLIFRIFPGAMAGKASSVSGLVYLVEKSQASDVSVTLSSFASASRNAVIRDSFPDGAKPNAELSGRFKKEVGPLAQTDIEREVRFRTLNLADLRGAQSEASSEPFVALSAFEVSVQISEGRVLSVLYSPMAIVSARSIWLALLLLAMFIAVNVTALRMIFKPLRNLETAAHYIGTSTKFVPVEETGTEDLRRVARALNASQTRVKTLLAERSQMLAALAHDIRTGLTHLKLRLDKTPIADSEAFNSDIATMEHLINDMLLYARSEQPRESLDLIELNEFVRETVHALPYEVRTTISDAQFQIAADRWSLKRAFNNLLDNAHRYANGASVTTCIDQTGFTIEVADNGPGISADDLEKVFNPFIRLESSRNRETGGSGLGLSISRALLSANGATLNLSNRDNGGLSAKIFFALEQRVD